MFLKNKIVVTFIAISLYVMGVFLAHSGDLFNEIQNIRYENQIRKIKLSQTIIFSSGEWQTFSNKKEIKYNNAYYDVISFRKYGSEVIAKVVKDEFENEFRLTISQVLNKNKIPTSEKKSTFISIHLAQKYPLNIGFKINFGIDAIENYNTQFNLKTSSFVNLMYDPPC